MAFPSLFISCSFTVVRSLWVPLRLAMVFSSLIYTVRSRVVHVSRNELRLDYRRISGGQMKACIPQEIGNRVLFLKGVISLSLTKRTWFYIDTCLYS